ncbi:MAG: hypothetical protein ACK5DJ_00010 [Bacteroidota bacterium]
MSKRFFLFLITALLTTPAWSIDEKEGYVSMGKLVEQGLLDVKVEMLHKLKNGLNVTLENKTVDSLKVWIEPGRRFIAKDSVYQDWFIGDERMITMMPLGTVEQDLLGFCCQVHDSGPADGAKYTIGYMAPVTWIELATLIHQNDFPKSASQHAVWCLSDNLPASSIYDADEKNVRLLRQLVCKIKGEQMPWYMLSYQKDSTRLFSNIPERLLGNVEYYLRNSAVVTINIRSSTGEVVKVLAKESGLGPGMHKLPVDLNVKGWPKGKYDVMIYTDYATLVSKSTFIL